MVRLEYQLGPLPVNFRSLLEPKGFLRIVLLLVAILAFSITAGFNSSGTSNSVNCATNSTLNSSTSLTFGYPYASGDFRFTSGYLNGTACDVNFSTKPLSGSAQFFVAMGVLTMIYCIALLLVNVFFMTPEFFMAKYITIGDFIGSVVMTVFYVLACIAWSVGTAQLSGYVSSQLKTAGMQCLQCPESAASEGVNVQNFAQPAISLIFGWLEVFLWVCSLWFVFKDTPWHAGLTGPLSSLYRKKEESAEGTGGGDQN